MESAATTNSVSALAICSRTVSSEILASSPSLVERSMEGTRVPVQSDPSNTQPHRWKLAFRASQQSSQAYETRYNCKTF